MGDEGKKIELSDIFSKKSKKNKPKAVNLNSTAAGTSKEEQPKPKAKAKGGGNDAWEDDSVTATEMKVQALANLETEEKKEDPDAGSGVHWNTRKQKETAMNAQDKKKFPTLGKAVLGKQIAMQDDGDPIALKMKKNKFDAFQEEEEDDPRANKSSAMVTKVKGEHQQDAAARAKAQADKLKKQKRKEMAKADNDDVESSEEEVVDAPSPEKKAPERKKVTKKVVKEVSKENESGDDVPETPAAADTLIEPDVVAARSKYTDRKRLVLKELPARELANKANKKAAAVGSKKPGKKGKNVIVDDDDAPKIMVAPEGW